MSELNINTMHISEIDGDGDISIKIDLDYPSDCTYQYVNKQDAIAIINHLKKQFNL